MKKTQHRDERLPQLEDRLVRWTERSDELLAKVLKDDFCEFGSSEVIGVPVQRSFAG